MCFMGFVSRDDSILHRLHIETYHYDYSWKENKNFGTDTCIRVS